MKNVFSLNQRKTSSNEQSKQLILEALPNIRRYAYSLTANAADADDLLQSLVERLLKTSIPSDTNSLAWMLRVCRNLWIDECRKRQVSAKYIDGLLETSESTGFLEDGIESKVVLEDIHKVLFTLSMQQREVLSLVIISGLTYAETANVMNVPVGTVMSRLARARQALAQAISSGSGDE